MFSRYTMTWYQVTQEVEDPYAFITWTNTTRKAQLIRAIESQFLPYEIAGETIPEQLLYMSMTFNEFEAQYAELLDKYSEDYGNLEDYTTVSSTTKDKHVELPNKQISDDDMYNYPDSGNKSDSSTTDPSLLLSLRKTYLAQVRNLYREFAMRFSGNFIHMY